MNNGYDFKCRVIVKVGNDQFLTYKVTDLLRFTAYLDRHFSNWRWFNVYVYTSDKTGAQIGNFTKNYRPQKSYI